MQLQLIHLFQQQRDLYEMPRNMERFRAYIQQMTGGTDDIVLPIVGMNPMGKDKAMAAYDALLRIRAETIAEEALVEARQRLSHVPGKLQVALVVLDDAQGAWSWPDQNEESAYLSDASAKRNFATAHFYSSQAPFTPQIVREGVMAAVYHIAWIQVHGVPRTLADVLRLVGTRDHFAAIRPTLPSGALVAARRIIAAHLRAPAKSPAAFACMFGDEAANKWGLARLGLPVRAGFEVALSQAAASGKTPESQLAGNPAGTRENPG